MRAVWILILSGRYASSMDSRMTHFPKKKAKAAYVQIGLNHLFDFSDKIAHCRCLCLQHKGENFLQQRLPVWQRKVKWFDDFLVFINLDTQD